MLNKYYPAERYNTKGNILLSVGRLSWWSIEESNILISKFTSFFSAKEKIYETRGSEAKSYRDAPKLES